MDDKVESLAEEAIKRGLGKDKKVKKELVGNGGIGAHLDDKNVSPNLSPNTIPPEAPRTPTPHVPQLPQVPYYNKLNNKDKIMFILFDNNRSVSEIYEISQINKRNILKTIKRTERETGLYYDNLVEVKSSEGVDIWGLTDKGKEYVNNIIEGEKRLVEYERMREEKARELREYSKKVQLYFSELEVTSSNYVFLDYDELMKYDYQIAERFEDDFENELAFAKQFVKTQVGHDIDVTLTSVPERLKKDIGSLKYDDFGKLRIIEGMVKSRSDRRPKITSSKFECFNCGDIKIVLQNEKHFVKPGKCECKGKYVHMPQHDKLVTIQRIEVEEFSEDLKGVNEPRYVNLILMNSLCNDNSQRNFNPGMRLKFWGTLKRDWSIKERQKQTILDYYFEVNGYEVLDQTLEFAVSEENKKEIMEFVKKPNFFDILAKSFSPHISGCLNIKKALLISSVKGLKYENVINRDRIHVLLVSDPGHGKTVLVKKLVEITPYSRFATGLNSSKAGLTASVVKDEFLGGWRLSAGAVPLANNGICVVDELDKFQDDDKMSLNGVMEEGEVVVDKATVHQKLKANTTIISTCNPKNEKFDNSWDKIPQLNLPRSLIDRFDLIFAVHTSSSGNKYLKSLEEDYTQFVNDDFISKFLILAMNNKPVMSSEVAKYIAEVSDKIEKSFEDVFTFGFRQFNGMFRLSFAIAKIFFRENVIKEDVDMAKDLFISSLNSLDIFGKEAQE